MTVFIAGTGSVGLVTAACLAQKGHNVICYDINPTVISKLENGICHIYEPGLKDLLAGNADRLKFTLNIGDISNADVVIICVPTPSLKNGSADLTAVWQTVEDAIPLINKDCVIAVKSTVPPGTCTAIAEYVSGHCPKDVCVTVAANPEFLSQGKAVQDTLCPHRIVAGVNNFRTEEVMRTLYAEFAAPLVVTDFSSAEMIKYASNCFLATRVSFINEIANLCEIVGTDIKTVSYGMGLDPRIGADYLEAGVGYGGSCLSKDVSALIALGEKNNSKTPLCQAVAEVNDMQKYILISKLRKYYASFRGLKIAVIGYAFKLRTNDINFSIAKENIDLLLAEGATVSLFDPLCMHEVMQLFNGKEITVCEQIEDVLYDADACLIFTAQPEIVKLSPSVFSSQMRRAVVLDGRNCLDSAQFQDTGVIYEGVGTLPIN